MFSALIPYHRHPGTCLTALIMVAVAAWIGVDEWNTQYQRSQVARVLTLGDASRAPPIMRRYGCAGCHTIPGVAGADGQVGGSLSDIRQRVYIGGVATIPQTISSTGSSHHNPFLRIRQCPSREFPKPRRGMSRPYLYDH